MATHNSTQDRAGQLLAYPLRNLVPGLGNRPRFHVLPHPQIPALIEVSRPARLIRWCLACVLLSPSLAHSQAPPDAGSILRETERSATPQATPTLPPVYLPSEEKPPAEGFRVLVREFRISRATLFTESELKALVSDLVGRELSFAELQQAATRIGEHYRKKGYLARALLPPQTIQDGIVEIIVLEGKLGDVNIELAPKSRLDKELARAIILRQQKIGEPLRLEDAERGVRLVGDFPGVSAQAMLVPGQKAGETNLLLRAEDGPLFSGLGTLDNQGIKSTGIWRAIANVAINNPSGKGDQATLLGLGGERHYYVRAGYTFRVGLDGLRLGINGSYLDYRLEPSFAALDGKGWAATAGLTSSYPLLRAVDRNAYLGLNYEEKHFANEYAGINASDRRISVLNLLLSGDRIDTFLGGGLTQFSGSVGYGRLRMKNADEIAIDAAGPDSRGGYTRVGASLSRLQRLTDTMGLYVALSAQFANKNLDSSEKFSLGGPNGVRAYPVNEGNGDEGWLATAELRRSLSDALQLVGFLDAGEIRVNRSPWAGWNAGTPNKPLRYGLYGAGVGISYARASDFHLRGILATPIGSNPGRDANGNDSDGRSDSIRAWVQLMKFF